jgi:hypothetical protein
MYSWQLDEITDTAGWIEKALNMRQLCMGRDHSDTIRNQHVLERVIVSRRDRGAYNKARREHSLETLAGILTRTSQMQGTKLQQKKNSRPSSVDWRLENVEKARWLAKIYMEREARNHVDWNYISVQYLAEDVRLLEGIPPMEFSCWGPYADIVVWLDRGNNYALPHSMFYRAPEG